MDIYSFSRKPYTVVYKDLHSGELMQVKRRPPEKLHTMLPTDIVELSSKRNDDWLPGDQAAIKHIGARQPNTLQLQDDEGNTTFVNHSEVELIDEVADRGLPQLDNIKANRYLLWP